MKKLYFILLPLLLIIGVAASNLLSQGNIQRLKSDKETLQGKTQKINTSDIPSEHKNQSLNCKSCHESEYPTKNDPGLRNCPRKTMASDFPTSREGPNVVVINEMSENYSGVVFSHKIHSQMSEMSIGCTGCHHYNTTGPVLSCKECHEKKRTRDDVAVPDLMAAYHRQCMSCHKQWSHENGCGTQCHAIKGSENTAVKQQNISNKTHPVLTEPAKLTWETNYESGKIVTFFHNEHNKIFKINCKSCHSRDNCITCHDTRMKRDFSNPIRTQKSFEDHHKPCISCHEGNTCDKCHGEKEMAPFNHGKSAGWVLTSYHSRLDCAKCHGNNMPYKKLDKNCISCHKNFTPGNFDHTKTGIILTETHKELECNNCHPNNNFAQAPECKMCHDEKMSPSQLSLKKGKENKLITKKR
jgi:hypothetical protein